MTKMVYITTLFPSNEKPYYCIYLYQQISELKKLGYDILLVYPDNKLSDGEIKKSRFKEFEIKHIGYKTNKFSIITNYVYPEFIKRLAVECDGFLPDVIAMNMCTLPLVNTITKYANKSKIPIYIHYHGLNVFSNYYYDKHKWLTNIQKVSKRRLIGKMDCVIGVSDKVCDIVRKNTKAKKVFTVYNGVDNEIFHHKDTEATDIFKIIIVANLIEIKGHRYLFEALSKVKKARPNQKFSLDIVGSGPLLNEYKEYVKILNIEKETEFFGELNYEKVAEKIRESNFLIMPSYFEALGCVYLEAMASKVACLGVIGCGIDEIIVDRENGYLVNPKSADEIADAIIFAMNNPQKHNRIAQNGYETAIKNYLWTDSAKRLDIILKSII